MEGFFHHSLPDVAVLYLLSKRSSTLLTEQSSGQLCVGIRASVIWSRLVVTRIVSEDVCIKESLSQLSPVVPLGSLKISVAQLVAPGRNTRSHSSPQLLSLFVWVVNLPLYLTLGSLHNRPHLEQHHHNTSLLIHQLAEAWFRCPPELLHSSFYLIVAPFYHFHTVSLFSNRPEWSEDWPSTWKHYFFKIRALHWKNVKGCLEGCVTSGTSETMKLDLSNPVWVTVSVWRLFRGQNTAQWSDIIKNFWPPKHRNPTQGSCSVFKSVLL